MANSINWGKIYCFTEFGSENSTIAESIPGYSAAACFLGPKEPGQIETLALTVDNTSTYTIDSTVLKADQTLI
jgi:hypothetical protein